jgi:membrane-bound lytic murein transglycosylase MltF
VRHAKARAVADTRDLAGSEVYVVKGSSYVQHLEKLNELLKKQGLKKIKIVEADKHLQSEDLLQMVNAGIYQYTVIDEPIAKLWSEMLDDIVLQPEVVINRGGQIAWAVRKDNKQLLEKLNRFADQYRQGTLHGNILLKRYYEETRWIDNPVADDTLERLHRYQKSFMKYGEQYKIDWVLLTAQGYQESKLNQNAASRHGAVGVMQIKPSTAADKNIGIKGVKESADKNIHAATKYLAFLRQRYFSDKDIEPFEQLAFTLAAYNAGPARITQMRGKAKQLGLDPNRWFFNVEHATRRFASKEPVDYVANIIKYQIAFKSVIETEKARSKAASKAQK